MGTWRITEDNGVIFFVHVLATSLSVFPTALPSPPLPSHSLLRPQVVRVAGHAPLAAELPREQDQQRHLHQWHEQQQQQPQQQLQPRRAGTAGAPGPSLPPSFSPASLSQQANDPVVDQSSSPPDSARRGISVHAGSGGGGGGCFSNVHSHQRGGSSQDSPGSQQGLQVSLVSEVGEAHNARCPLDPRWSSWSRNAALVQRF